MAKTGSAGTASSAGKKVATDLADDWVEGWNTNDQLLVSSTFGCDGISYSWNGDFALGKQNKWPVGRAGHLVNKMERVGKLKTICPGTYRFKVEADLGQPPHAPRYQGTLLLKLADDKIGLLTWLKDPEPLPTTP